MAERRMLNVERCIWLPVARYRLQGRPPQRAVHCWLCVHLYKCAVRDRILVEESLYPFYRAAGTEPVQAAVVRSEGIVPTDTTRLCFGSVTNTALLAGP